MKIALLAISAALLGAGNALHAFANGEAVPEGAQAGDTGGDTGSTAAPRRGRPPGSASKAAESATAGTAAATPATDDAARFTANRELIKPLVDGNQGEEVKKVIAKYSKTGLKDLPADKQADFEKDIAALSY